MNHLPTFTDTHSRTTTAYARIHVWKAYHPKTMQHVQHAALVAVCGFTLLNAGVFTAQRGRLTAFVTVQGKPYGLMAVDAAKNQLKTQHQEATLNINAAEKVFKIQAIQAGIQIDTDKTIKTATSKKGWQRIPVVGTIGNMFHDVTPIYSIDEEKLQDRLQKQFKDQIITPKNASVVIPADPKAAIQVVKEQSGSEFTAALAAESVAQAVRAGTFDVNVKPKTLQPKFSERSVRAYMPAIESARKTSMTIQAADKKIALSSEVLAPMLTLKTDGTELQISIDQTALAAYLNSQSKDFYEAPIAVKTVQLDGSEVSRIEGREGKQIDAAGTARLAALAFEKGVTSVTPAFATVTPEVLVTKTYSNTDTGLYKTIEDFANSHAGTYRVAAVELKGPSNRSAFYNADSSVITASTYKLFIAYGILQRIEAGSLKMESATSKGTVRACMEKMIHISDNDCASALQTILGWKEFDQKLKADGFTSTQLNNPNGTDKHTTARDEMNLVTKLYNHELLSQASTDYLFGLMEDQIYRKGIPAGSRGATVADKVGFLYALNHDIGVVYAPKSTYALVILTDGAGGWTNVKLLAEQVYDFYNQ